MCEFTDAPATSKRPKRIPFTPAIITSFREQLDLNSLRDAAVFACMTTTFYSIARLGEFTVPTIRSFDPAKHITRAHVSSTHDRHGFPVTKFHIPSTKTAPVAGEDAFWSQQDGLSDPKAALENHFRVNNPEASSHLFTWNHPKGPRSLSRKEFISRIHSIATTKDLPDLKGHGLRIGGTLEYLLRGIPFDVVKSMGRWSSEAFTIYLRHHATILAPYIQANPVLEPFTRYTMPPVL